MALNFLRKVWCYKLIKFLICICLSIFISAKPIFSQSGMQQYESCPVKPQDGLVIPAAWRAKFPFDLVYPVSSFDTDIDDLSKCPQVSLWDFDYEMCSIPMVAQVVKNSFLLRLVYVTITQG